MAVICIFPLLFLVPLISEIQKFASTTVKGSPYPNKLYYEPMFSVQDSPNPIKNPFIKYDLTVTTLQPFQIAYLIIGKRENIIKNGVISHEVHTCDTQSFRNENITKIIIKFEQYDSYDINGIYYIKHSGLYSSFFIPCGEGIVVDGIIEFRNPYGYLPGNKYFYLPYYHSVVAIYIVLLLTWSAILYLNKNNLFHHHLIIIAIILFTLLETIFNDFEHVYVNNNGFKNSFLYFSARVFSVFRKTFIRTIIVLVSFGYGVVELKLSKLNDTVIRTMTFTYFVINIFMELYLFENNQTTEHLDIILFIFKSLNLFANCVYFLLIYTGMTRTMEDLRCHERYYLRLYNYFALLLLILVITSTMFFLMDIDYRSNQMLLYKNWKHYWWYDSGFNMVQTTLILIVVMYAWIPSRTILYNKITGLGDLTGNKTLDTEEESSFSENSVDQIDPDEIIKKKQRRKRQTILEMKKAHGEILGDIAEDDSEDIDSESKEKVYSSSSEGSTEEEISETEVKAVEDGIFESKEIPTSLTKDDSVEKK